jgi:hypothetical protein
MGIDKNSGKGSRSLKTTTDRPSIIKKEHAQRQIKGELRLPFVLSAIRVFTTAPVGASLLAIAVVQTDECYRHSAIASRLAPTREKLSDLLFA